jgi:metal-responsive CopG/Arc/MetJ family transcriptional regulator
VIGMTTINLPAMPNEQTSMNDRLTAFRLPDHLLKRVDDVCKRCKMTRSRFLRWAIVEFFDHHADEPER